MNPAGDVLHPSLENKARRLAGLSLHLVPIFAGFAVSHRQPPIYFLWAFLFGGFGGTLLVATTGSVVSHALSAFCFGIKASKIQEEMDQKVKDELEINKV